MSSDNKGILNAYEKMFEDGSAYKPIQIDQPTPSMSEVKGMGVKKDTAIPKEIVEENHEPDFSAFDKTMEEKLNESRARRGGSEPKGFGNSQASSPADFSRLERRLELIENALSMVMATQKKLIEG